MTEIVKIIFPNNKNSEVYVYRDEQLIFKLERQFHFGTRITARLFEKENNILEINDFFFTTKLEQLNLLKKIKVKNNNILFSKFLIESDEVKITENFFYFITKRVSKTYWNNKLFGEIELKKILDFGGIEYEVRFKNNDFDKQYFSIICILISSLRMNI